MRQDSFDIPAYRFYIVIPEFKYFHGVERYEDSINRNQCSYIPYEEIEGLTFGDYGDITHRYEIFIGCFCELNSTKNRVYRLPIFYCHPYYEEKTVERCESKLDYPELKDRLIDEVVTEHLEEQYAKASDYEKRIYRCFFERHQDFSHNDTKERVKRLEKIK